jgi:hypothetical protein
MKTSERHLIGIIIQSKIKFLVFGVITDQSWRIQRSGVDTKIFILEASLLEAVYSLPFDMPLHFTPFISASIKNRLSSLASFPQLEQVQKSSRIRKYEGVFHSARMNAYTVNLQ